jgi:hypothetical protein
VMRFVRVAGDRSHWLAMETVAEKSRRALQLLEDPDFVWRQIWPLVSGGENRPRDGTFELSVHRRRADGRAVAEYGFPGPIRVFAKLYPDPPAGRAVYRIHDELWRNGFGADSPNRVPEPLGYIEEHAVVLLRPVAGNSLVVTELEGREAFDDGVSRAARWLAALHSSPVRLGPRETVEHSMSRLRRRAENAAASRPDLEDVFRNALAELPTRYSASSQTEIVQTHGRYHAAHVFVSPQCITAVDLDRAALADRAKDVGEFLHVLRVIANVRKQNDRADDACERFLDEYTRYLPAALSGLTFYWSYTVLWTLLRLALKDRPARKGWTERVEFLRAEFDDVPRRTRAWLDEQ